MRSLTIFFDTINAVLILTFKIDFPTLKPLSTATCPLLKVNIVLIILASSLIAFEYPIHGSKNILAVYLSYQKI